MLLTNRMVNLFIVKYKPIPNMAKEYLVKIHDLMSPAKRLLADIPDIRRNKPALAIFSSMSAEWKPKTEFKKECNLLKKVASVDPSTVTILRSLADPSLFKSIYVLSNDDMKSFLYKFPLLSYVLSLCSYDMVKIILWVDELWLLDVSSALESTDPVRIDAPQYLSLYSNAKSLSGLAYVIYGSTEVHKARDYIEFLECNKQILFTVVSSKVFYNTEYIKSLLPPKKYPQYFLTPYYVDLTIFEPNAPNNILAVLYNDCLRYEGIHLRSGINNIISFANVFKKDTKDFQWLGDALIRHLSTPRVNIAALEDKKIMEVSMELLKAAYSNRNALGLKYRWERIFYLVLQKFNINDFKALCALLHGVNADLEPWTLFYREFSCGIMSQSDIAHHLDKEFGLDDCSSSSELSLMDSEDFEDDPRLHNLARHLLSILITDQDQDQAESEDPEDF